MIDGTGHILYPNEVSTIVHAVFKDVDLAVRLYLIVPMHYGTGHTTFVILVGSVYVEQSQHHSCYLLLTDLFAERILIEWSVSIAIDCGRAGKDKSGNINWQVQLEKDGEWSALIDKKIIADLNNQYRGNLR
jgi:hypothetical protein